jgi:hypothetical protein
MVKQLGLSTLLLVLIPAAAQGTHRSATEEWWKSAPNGEQISFVDGFLDCFVYDSGSGKNGLNITSGFWAPKITAFYQEHPNEMATPIANVLAKLIQSSQGSPRRTDGETAVLRGRHAPYDSDYWRTRFPEERIGFLEGYLSCQKLNDKPSGVFSKSDEWYADQISRWYGLKTGTDEIDEHKAGAKIATVLYLFRDRSEKK